MTVVRHDGSLQPYDETWDLPITPAIVTGQFSVPNLDNYDVTIYPDIKKGHDSSSPHQTDDHPTMYWSIPHVIAHGQHYASSAQTQARLSRAKTSHTEVYQLDNIYELLDNPNWYASWPSHSIVVPVIYHFDGKPNKALTFYVAPNPTGRRLG